MGKKKSKLIIKDDDGKVILDTGISHSDLLKPYESKIKIHEFDEDGELYYPSQEEIINRWRKTKDEAELKKKYGKNWRDRFRKKKSGSIPNYLSKWGKEVVKYLLKNGEKKMLTYFSVLSETQVLSSCISTTASSGDFKNTKIKQNTSKNN